MWSFDAPTTTFVLPAMTSDVSFPIINVLQSVEFHLPNNIVFSFITLVPLQKLHPEDVREIHAPSR